MTEPETPLETKRRKKKRSTVPTAVLLILMLILGIALGWLLFSTQGEKPASTALEGIGPPAIESTLEIKEIIPPAAEEKSVRETIPAKPAEDDQALAPTTPLPADPPTEEEKLAAACAQRAERLHAFFQQLDEKEYIQAFKLDSSAQNHFLDLAAKLFANPPVVSRETDDLYTILKNMAHFFRIIGQENILIMKGIFDRERQVIEDVASDLYQWSAASACTDERFQFTAPLDKLYEYAGFFLSTMGGRSYLFRRDSRSRLLVNYYALLIVDRANKKELNRHGIALADLLPLTIQEIESSNELIYKENYLDSLYDLLEEYQ